MARKKPYVCPRPTHSRTCYVHDRCRHPDAIEANRKYGAEVLESKRVRCEACGQTIPQ